MNKDFRKYICVFTNHNVLENQTMLWYPNLNTLYKNILSSNGFCIMTKNISKKKYVICSSYLKNLLLYNSSRCLYIFNPMDFVCFSLAIKNSRREKIGAQVLDFINRVNYIIIWQEIILENLDIVGYNKNIIDKDFILKFFGGSRLNIISNMISIDNLEKYNITHNKYFTVTGYSVINNIIPFYDDAIECAYNKINLDETINNQNLNPNEDDMPISKQEFLQDTVICVEQMESLSDEPIKLLSENILLLSSDNKVPIINKLSLTDDKISNNDSSHNLYEFNDKFEKKNKMIDVLIYGTMHDTYKYRNTLISELQKINDNKYNIFVSGNLYGEKLDEILKDTKIVVHVCSFAGLEHMPWPKITYLQSRKIFYIIEDNDELHKKNLEDFVVTYQKGNIHDLFQKIEYYLTNEDIKKEIIDKNFNYIMKNSNMDVIIPDIIKGVINDI